MAEMARTEGVAGRGATRVFRRVLLAAVAGVLAPMAFLGVGSSSALAAPTGIFAAFAQCPTSIPGVALCQYMEVTSGEFAIGSLRVPVDRPIVLQGGAIPTGGSNFNEYFLLPAANGESISQTELEVPGGLSSVIGCPSLRDGRGFSRGRRHDPCSRFWGWGASRVSATVESVAGPTNPPIQNIAALVEEKGTALTFPARIHLKNPVLGEGCYLGSESSPIELHLTDGTTSPPPPNQPITGKAGIAATEVEEGYEALTTSQSTLVDNSFSVPPAEGCGGELSSIIDPLLDHTLGLESPAGHNTLILNATNKIAEAEAVLASEKFPAKPSPEPSPHHHHHHW
ncbi:MAG TPA: hypothetical protein VGL68_00335 [Solirubrobacteraceae bacterium]